ncbi:MAG: helix-turn-helix domain-containing protein [Minisyncoccia bacterium]
MRKKDAIYDAEKLARFFGVTKKTVWDWCKRGKLPGFKIGKQWKVRVADLQKMIDRKIRHQKENAAPATPKLF